MENMRTEKDALGEVQVPADKYYGAQTQRAVDNFRIGTEYFPWEFIQSHALVKKAAALTNCSLGLLSPEITQAIVEAADEVISGELSSEFPLVIWQSGSGTQFNMNVNEVIANRASELLGGEKGKKSPVHPNDHVNMAQSTNDTIPASMHITAAVLTCNKLLPELEAMRARFGELSERYAELLKSGRTHLMDATPLTLGQEFSGYEYQLTAAIETINTATNHLFELAIGGTAVGTGLNSHPDYSVRVVEQICELTDMPFKPARNLFAALAAHDAIVELSGALKTLATALMKIANDIRWMGSGPRCGLGELILPGNEPGSSIMPGKINPTQCEMITQIACQVIGNDTTITLANSQGNFELNVFKPLLAYNIIQSINILADGVSSFNENCLDGLQADEERITEHLNNSLMLVTALNRHIGYDKAAQIALKAWREKKTLKQAALELELLTAEQYDNWVRPQDMTQPAL
ncbi:MAG: class II fumarate hydratase [Sedimentisphaerales bacterium]|nr:class II fumarate hydratase [Sedimentisphaerales bacterium]MBN2841448.1 class II fumarate hydratase [Sedimentisphaerales bacterium]